MGSRAATAAGTVGGLTLTAGEVAFADLGITKLEIITICTGTGC